MHRDSSTLKLSSKRINFALKVDMSSRRGGTKKNTIGCLSINLSKYANKSGATANVCYAFEDQCSVTPAPYLWLRIACEWKKVDSKPITSIAAPDEGSVSVVNLDEQSSVLISAGSVVSIGRQTFMVSHKESKPGDDLSSCTSDLMSESDMEEAEEFVPDDEHLAEMSVPLGQREPVKLFEDRRKRSRTLAQYDTDTDEEGSDSEGGRSRRLSRSSSFVGKVKKSIAAEAGDRIHMNFCMEFVEAGPFPVDERNRIFYLSYRRGSKRQNQGSTSKTMCDMDGKVMWSGLSSDESKAALLAAVQPGDNPASPRKGIVQIHSTMFLNPKTRTLEDKSIALVMKRQGKQKKGTETKFERVAHAILDIASFVTTEQIDAGLAQQPPVAASFERYVELSSSKFDSLSLLIRVASATTSAESTDAPAKEPEKKVEEGRVFGKPLADQIVENGERVREIPLVATFIMDRVQSNFIDQLGIFRVSGRQSEVNSLKHLFDNGKEDEAMKTEYGAHVLCSALKLYIRTIPGGLLPSQCYEQFLQIGKEYAKIVRLQEQGDDTSALVHTLMVSADALLRTLPQPNLALLHHLFVFLGRVADHSESNKMPKGNLCTVFGPTIMEEDLTEIDPMTSMMDNAAKIFVARFLLDFFGQILPEVNFVEFDRELAERSASLSPEEQVELLKQRLQSMKLTHEKSLARLENELLSAVQRSSTSQMKLNIVSEEALQLRRENAVLALLSDAIHEVASPVYVDVDVDVDVDAEGAKGGGEQEEASSTAELSSSSGPIRVPPHSGAWHRISYSTVVLISKIFEWKCLEAPIDGPFLATVLTTIDNTLRKVYGNDDYLWYLLSTTCSMIDALQQSEEVAIDGSIGELGIWVTSDDLRRRSVSNPTNATAAISVRSLDNFDEHLNRITYRIFSTLVNHCTSMIDACVVGLLSSNGDTGEEMEGLLSRLEHFLEVATTNYIIPSVIRQFFDEIMFFVNKTLFNIVMSNRSLLTPNTGLHLKIHIGEFDPWISSLPDTWGQVMFDCKERQLRKLEDLGNLLITASNTAVFEGEDVGLASFPSLDPIHLKHVFTNYQCEKGEAASFRVNAARIVKRLEGIDGERQSLYIAESTTLLKSL
eukprot:TRINITY_DN8226_c1_g1_i1.p1 TRINITY_DN8226_c1_g1~~TRINITY_DN8226_c1_g1_i1.p1  ORF type:complete len:1212 (-),score=319.05 TRINITY_DN8226_c1_g1_i1:78-3416(-)